MSDTAKENRITSSGYTAGVMTFSKYTLDTIPGVPPHYMIYQHKESYRYDALGRRVWVELVRDTNCTTHDVDSDCSNYVRRVNWDGDQILHETQVAARASTHCDHSDARAPGAHALDRPIRANYLY